MNVGLWMLKYCYSNIHATCSKRLFRYVKSFKNVSNRGGYRAIRKYNTRLLNQTLQEGDGVYLLMVCERVTIFLRRVFKGNLLSRKWQAIIVVLLVTFLW